MIESDRLVDFLRSHEITQLYHANSTSTWVSCIEAGGLLSRQEMDRRNLWKTYQNSDRVDKEYDVYDDIFLDIYDLHSLFARANSYGPVLGVLPIEILRDKDFEIYITRTNPIYWENGNIDTNYFQSNREYENMFVPSYERGQTANLARMMITIKKPKKSINIDLIKIFCIDSPQISYENELLYSIAAETLSRACQNNIEILHREYCENCSCDRTYIDNPELTRYMFFNKERIMRREHKTQV